MFTFTLGCHRKILTPSGGSRPPLAGVRLEAGDQFFDVRFHLGQGVRGHRIVEIVHVPVFDAVGPRGKARFHQSAMLGFFEGHDQLRRFEIAHGGVDRMAQRLGKRDLQTLELAPRVDRKRTDVARVEGQPPRIGPPGQVVADGQPVEINLGEPAAIEIAGAQKQDSVNRSLLAMGGGSSDGSH